MFNRCGHCKHLKPEFAKAAGELKRNDPPITLAKVDCTEAGKDTCGKYSVSGYPTLKIFSKSEMISDYNGPREADGIVKYMKVILIFNLTIILKIIMRLTSLFSTCFFYLSSSQLILIKIVVYEFYILR